MEYNPISVTDLNKYIKEKIDNDENLNNVLVKGEISNFKHHYTGHMYFTLKDENSLIKCIMFKTYTANLNFVPKDGMKVNILGTVSVFERDGVYQIYCKAMKEDGIGDLYKAYEELKNKLEAKGLFDKKYKKEIPKMPKSVGVLTSDTGSVIRDIINVSTRRNPNCYIKLFPVPVQGKGAGEKIAEAIKIMNKYKPVDVIILARGGGSLEDLWPFNEEVVANAIFESEIPIISAVGHETDFTISDFVSDLRAPTPSAAAELAIPNISDVKLSLENYEKQYKNSLRKNPFINYDDENIKPLVKMINNIIFEIMCWKAQNERETIRKRQAEGIAVAKAKGKKFGRPKIDLPSNFEEEYTKWKKGEQTAKITILNLSCNSVLHTLYEKREDAWSR